jgi:hypothetical protein
MAGPHRCLSTPETARSLWLAHTAASARPRQLDLCGWLTPLPQHARDNGERQLDLCGWAAPLSQHAQDNGERQLHLCGWVTLLSQHARDSSARQPGTFWSKGASLSAVPQPWNPLPERDSATARGLAGVPGSGRFPSARVVVDARECVGGELTATSLGWMIILAGFWRRAVSYGCFPGREACVSHCRPIEWVPGRSSAR